MWATRLTDQGLKAVTGFVNQIPTKVVATTRVPVEDGVIHIAKKNLTFGQTTAGKTLGKGLEAVAKAKIIFDAAAYIRALYECSLEIPK